MDTQEVEPCVQVATRTAVAALLAGLGLSLAAFAALAAIPRGLHEFVYYSFPSYASTLEPLPFAPGNGFTPEQLSSHLARALLLAPACVLVGIGLAPLLARGSHRARLHWRVAALASCLIVAAVAAWVIRGVPLQDDDATYLMQASAIAEGRLFDPPVPVGLRWGESFTLFTRSGTTGKYLFGTPFVLSLGMRLEIPILAHVLLVFATLYLVFRAAHEAGAGRTASLGTALLAFSPELLFTSATPTSQTPALAGVAVAVWAAGRGGDFAGLLAGTALGAVFTCRPQLALPCGIAVLLPALWRDRRFLRSAILAGIPWVAMVLLYDAALTGHALRLPWDAFAVERYGFGWWSGEERGYYFHPIKAVLNVASVLIRLNGWALGWPVSLAGPVAWLLLRRPNRAAVAPWAWIALATFVFQFSYYSVGTSETGAVYHYAALPFIALSTAAALERLLAGPFRHAVAGGALAAAVLGTGSFVVEHGTRLRRLTDWIDEPVRTARAQAQVPALVFLEPHFAGRLPVGWVFGPPYRLRGTYEPMVMYPAGLARANEALRASQSQRHCYYEYYDYPGARYRLTDCAEMQRLHEQFMEDSFRLRYPHPESPDGRFPRWIDGGWRPAFRWIPFLSS